MLSVQLRINQAGDWRQCHKHPTIPNLYTLPWEPEKLPHRKNVLTVTATDANGNSRTVDMSFQVEFDEIDNEYTLYARMILMCDVISVVQFLWISSFLTSVLPLLLARLKPSVLRQVYSLAICAKLEELAAFTPFSLLYIISAMLVSFGPWHVGEILSGHTGIIFPWATMVAGQTLPSFYPYIFSSVTLFCFHIPLFWSLLYKFKWRVEGNKSKILLALSNIPVTLVLSSQACLLIVLYYYPSRLGILKEICLLIAPVQVTCIVVGFVDNALISFYINRVNNSRK